LHIGTSIENETGFGQLPVRPVVAQGAAGLSGTFTAQDVGGAEFENVVLVSPFTMSFGRRLLTQRDVLERDGSVSGTEQPGRSKQHDERGQMR